MATVQFDLYFYHPDHLSSASWITDIAGTAIQHLQYLPFGETRVDQRTTIWNSRYSFSAKEKDEESGYGYFGARYYDSDLSIWLSVDPMSDKYPMLTPYNYCANNPIKLVDPNGEEFGDFFSWTGKKLGTDGKDDDNVFIVSDRQSRKTIKSDDRKGGTTDASTVKVDVSTTKEVLSNVLDVNDRTQSNGNFMEEATFMTSDGNFSAQGNDIRNTPFEDPISVDITYTGAIDASIHSHVNEFRLNPNGSGEISYNTAFSASGADKKVNANLNIITGPLSAPSWNERTGSFDKATNFGAVFYDRNWSNQGSMSIRALSRILSH